jgi:hypothetical protein
VCWKDGDDPRVGWLGHFGRACWWASERRRKKGKGLATDLGREGFRVKNEKRIQQFVFKFDSRIGF